MLLLTRAIGKSSVTAADGACAHLALGVGIRKKHFIAFH